VQVPQREASRQSVALLQRDGGCELQEAEVWRGGALLGAHADADEFDFGDEVAVAAVVLAHDALEVREVREVADVGLALAVAHAGVPDVVGFDETDEAAAAVAAEGVGGVVGVGREEVRAVVAAVLGLHGDVAGVALAGFDGGVDLGGVVARDDVLEAALVGGFEGGGADGGDGEGGGFDGDVEEARLRFRGREDAAGEAGDGADGLEVEVFPGAQVADVPPAVGVDAGADGEAGHEADGGVAARQVFGDGGGGAVGTLQLRGELAVGGWCEYHFG